MAIVYESLKHSNQFKFKCPVFDTETRMGACVRLRDLVAAGAPPVVRQGCQVAMRCGKCPAQEMVSKYCFDKNWTNDHHGSSTPKEGKLMKAILEKVRRPLIQDRVLTSFNPSERERELLLSANERIDQQLKTAPAESNRRGVQLDNKPVSYTSQKIATVKEDNATVSDVTINKAAAEGDLAAAINA